MGNNSEVSNVNEKVTLTVFRASPHVWAGGLEGEELANWLIGKANAIRWLVSQQSRAEICRQHLDDLQMTESLTMAYANLGLSHSEQDPIRPLSEEAIQFDKAVVASALDHKKCAEDTVIPPLEYSLLPDLAEEREVFLQKKEAKSAPDSSQFSQKENELAPCCRKVAPITCRVLSGAD
ncbi:hypothetical protein BTJ39_06015 [Izhakiella australiensis]|uniref:Uncharacterized protein n=1 Tax=Izhakiella australiensis TaxID=1926881 RepID=A0A1S8YNM0_9GAMM|nr:hypothetical protein [Izhakiella australiensis]OON40640.1 hypothetical protein BTJ39_06015 [Izhakiella australiensis]